MAAKIRSVVLVLLLPIAFASSNASTVDTSVSTEDDKPDTSKFLALHSSPSDAAVPSSSEPSVDMTAAAMESALTNLMLGKTAFGATPMGGSVTQIADILTKTMMPKVVSAHKAEQKAIDNLANELRKCGSTKDSSMKASTPAFNEYKRMSGLHKKCRGNQAVAYSSKMSCLDKQRSLYNEKKLKCEFFSAMAKKFGTQKDNNAIMKKAGSETTEGYITRISATICGKHVHGSKGNKAAKGGWGGGLPNSMLDQYLKAKDKCEQAKKAYNGQVKLCKAKVAAYKVKLGQCNQYQGLMDSNSCKRAVLVKDTCESYAGCYDSKKKELGNMLNAAVGTELDRKAEWRGLKRMSCLIKAFADGKVSNAEVNTCKKQTISTKFLTLKHPGNIPRKTCALPVLYPSTGKYKKAEFVPLPVLAKGIESAPCAGMDSVSTTPMKGSPRGAKCTRVGLNGPYSAGALVSCTGGHDVRRANDKNSCPEGTKIFSPASRADWKTVLESATRLANPHWIVDVTKPSNGGRKSNSAMNSGNKQQKAWRTSDGSPWWLRGTKYGEPSGDYHANCFLGLGGKPSNENHLTFNDANCNYHSKDYYCQPVKLNLKPKAGPASCKCSKVTLTGKYSAGMLVKCAECLSVSKSTQKNSCPNGMKIFSPRSRGDWKTFVSSASPLRAPHWIIDVTRPQNGCGGCTKYPMKSSTPQQATWKTSDGSPWWLRSTVYSEPSGDYSANCYLDLWRTPTSENTIQFNDAKCHYHSRSYYCQPKATKKKKAKPSPPAPPSKPKAKSQGKCTLFKKSSLCKSYAYSGKGFATPQACYDSCKKNVKKFSQSATRISYLPNNGWVQGWCACNRQHRKRKGADDCKTLRKWGGHVYECK